MTEQELFAALAAGRPVDLWGGAAADTTSSAAPAVQVLTPEQTATLRSTMMTPEEQAASRQQEIDAYRAKEAELAKTRSPYQDFTAGGQGYLSASDYYGGGTTPTQWFNIYRLIQTGQAQIKDVPSDEGGTAKALVFGDTVIPGAVTEVAPNVYSIRSTSGQYSANFVVGTDPNTSYVAPIQDMSKQYKSWRHDYSGGGLSGVISDIDPTILAIAISFAAPGIGSAIAAELGVSSVVGTAIANAAMNVAAGADPSTAIQNAVTNAVVQTGSAGVATEINSALSNLSPETAASISNAAGSALSSAATTAARGGSTDEIISNAIAGAAGSTVASETGDKVLGSATTGALTGGLEGALTGAAGAYLKLPSVEDKQGVPAESITPTDTAGFPGEAPVAFDQTPVTPVDTFTPVTAAQTGGLEPVSGYQEPAIPPVTQPPVQTADAGAITPTPPAPQEILIPDQISRETGDERVTFTPGEGDFVGEFTITAPRDEQMAAGGDTFVPDILSPADKQILDLTGSYSEPAMPTGPTTGQQETQQAAQTEEIAPTPYKPEFFVAGGVAPRMTTRPSTLAQTLQAPFYGAMPTTGLTSYRGAGEIESSETGGKRRNVWNEASLRLKDALGI